MPSSQQHWQERRGPSCSMRLNYPTYLCSLSFSNHNMQRKHLGSFYDADFWDPPRNSDSDHPGWVQQPTYTIAIPAVARPASPPSWFTLVYNLLLSVGGIYDLLLNQWIMTKVINSHPYDFVSSIVPLNWLWLLATLWKSDAHSVLFPQLL